MTGLPFVLLATLLLAGSPWSVATSVAAPLGPGASPDPCASAVPDRPNDLPAAFAYDLESPAILHFVAALATVPQREQKGVFDAAVAAASSPLEHEVETALAAICPNLNAIYGSSRASYLVVNQWKLAEFSDAKRFNDFSEVVATAMSALSAGNRLTPDERRSAMLPFSSFTSATPSPPPAEPGACSRPDERARPLRLVQPSYPPLARSAATAGTVRIRIALNDLGEVRSARIFDETLGRGLGSQDIIRASIFAAAASTYAPEIKRCVPVAGVYLFTAEYRRR